MTTGYYVTARLDGGTGNERVAWLCGPFARLAAAMAMVEPVRRAAARSDDDKFAMAHFSVCKLSRDKLPAGRLDLKLLNLDDILSAVKY